MFRCVDPDQALRLVAVKEVAGAGRVELVVGQQELDYWAKIAKDRQEKRHGKVHVNRTNTKKKLIQKMDTIKSAHVYFD